MEEGGEKLRRHKALGAAFLVRRRALGTRIEQPVLSCLRFNDDDKTELGWTIGAGAEVALSENWIVGMEADYYDFGTYGASKDVTNPPDPPQHATDYDVDASLWSILARVSYKFR